MLQLGKHLLNHSSIKNVYYAHIHSHLTYSLLTWGCMINKWQLNALMKIQKVCVRIICKKPSTYNSKVLFEQEHIPTLQNLIDLEAAKFGYKISHNLLPKPIQNIMNAKGGKKHTPIIHTKKNNSKYSEAPINTLQSQFLMQINIILHQPS